MGLRSLVSMETEERTFFNHYPIQVGRYIGSLVVLIFTIFCISINISDA